MTFIFRGYAKTVEIRMVKFNVAFLNSAIIMRNSKI